MTWSTVQYKLLTSKISDSKKQVIIEIESLLGVKKASIREDQ